MLGLDAPPRRTADGATIVSLPFGDSEVELLEPRAPDSPIAKFLERRGPGIHHVCYRVADLDAALAGARAAGYRLVDEAPRTGAGGCRIAFLHPKSTAGHPDRADRVTGGPGQIGFPWSSQGRAGLPAAVTSTFWISQTSFHWPAMNGTRFWHLPRKMRTVTITCCGCDITVPSCETTTVESLARYFRMISMRFS